jgi:signal peptidase II
VRGTRIFYFTAGAVFVLDQLTKALAVAFLSPSGGRNLSTVFSYFTHFHEFPYAHSVEAQAPRILGDYLKLTLTTNSGIAWGLFAGHPIELGILSVVLTVIIWFIFSRYGRRNLILALSLGLIFGGAIGNLVDRFRLLEVVDFIDVLIPIVNYDFPVFNLADSSASIGTLIIAAYLVHLDIVSGRRARILRRYDQTIYK